MIEILLRPSLLLLLFALHHFGFVGISTNTVPSSWTSQKGEVHSGDNNETNVMPRILNDAVFEYSSRWNILDCIAVHKRKILLAFLLVSYL